MGQASSRGTAGTPERPQPRSNRSSLFLRPASSRAADAQDVQQRRPRPRPRPLSFISSRSHSAAARLDAGPPSDANDITRRRSRLVRARTNLAAIPTILNRRGSSRQPESHTSEQADRTFSNTLTSPAEPTSNHDFVLPNLDIPDIELNIDDLRPLIDEHAQPITRRDPPRLASNLSDRISSLRPDRGIRSMTSSLRRRRSPLRRDEDQAAMLSRLLSVAAAATAASLMGDDHRAVAEARNVGGDGEDGTFESFIQALQNGRIASALRQSGGDTEDGPESPTGMAAPLNFFRMFRFSTGGTSRQDRSSRPAEQRESGTQTGDAPGNDDEQGGDGRLVPIIIVGIRSINPASGTSNDDHNIPPFLDALSSFPSPLTSPGESTIDGILRQPANGTRFSHRRRASMGGINTFPANYDSQRHHRSPDRSRPLSMLSDSPSGPRPPPSTPAGSALSRFPSESTTPTATPSSPTTSTTQSAAPSRRESFVRRSTGTLLDSTAEEPPRSQARTPRQRRLSESDFTRFGSGASRRNGVVEPDHTPVGEASRSWIIYVLGGSYPENHPILTTPSLFTDSPTYEDMLLLSALLGPAKPPVASEDDVASAGGVYRISGSAGNLTAIPLEASGFEDDDAVPIAVEQRCLVCLCDFEVGEEARKLVKCGHFFHKECIDQVRALNASYLLSGLEMFADIMMQWLTTGRNSCPLCRGQGVEEKPSETTTPESVPLPTTPEVS